VFTLGTFLQNFRNIYQDFQAMDGRMDRRADGRKDGRTDGRMKHHANSSPGQKADKQRQGQTDRQNNIPIAKRAGC
jgi:hypothetical protein